MQKTFDCIVLGLGGVGSSALLAAADHGWSVLGLEQFDVAHAKGSSHGVTRIIRTAYAEHPAYVPLAQMSWRMWTELESRANRQLLKQTGLVQVGQDSGQIVSGVLKSASQFGLDIEILSPQQCKARFPHFEMHQDEVCVYEKQAGLLFVEECIKTQIELARQAGAEILTESPVIGFERSGKRLIVSTVSSRFETERLIVAAGAWSSRLISHLQLPLRIIRKPQFWFKLHSADMERLSSIPAFLFDQNGHVYYGFPASNEAGLKVAEHSGGEAVVDPGNIRRDICDQDVGPVKAFVAERLGISEPQLKNHAVCMYTMTPTEHFIVDADPADPGIVFATGLSGHGFKFTRFLGSYLISLLDGECLEDRSQTPSLV